MEDDEIQALAVHARELRRSTPHALRVHPDANAQLTAFRRQAEQQTYTLADLDGWWNRYEGTLARSAALFAISEGSNEVTTEHVGLSQSLVRAYLYQPLEGLVEQIAAGRSKMEVFKLHDDLVRAGEEGIPLSTLTSRINSADGKRRQEVLADMKEMGLMWPGKDGKTAYGRKTWRDAANRAAR